MPRLPTVYDFSSLRLHPDGSQVLQSDSQNRKSRYAARTVQDSRGNWFARDAAGSKAVGKYRKEKEVKGMKQECEEQWDAVCEGEEDELSKRKGKGKEEGTTGQSSRSAKRQKFFQDFDFLTPTASEGSERTHALPSSDLLKSIHYFASSYYHERGQLFNATQGYRQKRKQNRLKRLGQGEPDHEGSGESDEDSEQDEASPPRRGGRTKGIGRIKYRKDMYKILDGSALMAIGMLIQEYVSRTLEVRIPDGWEDMMRDAHSDEEATAEDNAYSENNTENDRESQEDESRGDDDDDDSQRDEEEEEAGD